MNETKSLKYDFIKTIACILVVIAHVTRMFTPSGLIQPNINSDILADITKFIYNFHMPLFFLITGAVYSLCINDLGKYKDKKKFIKNKFLRLIIPYFLFGLFYIAPIMVVFKFTDLTYIEYCKQFIITGDGSRHLWFLITLFFIFVFFIFTNNKIKKINLIINVFIFTILYCISNFFGNIFGNIFRYIIYFYIGYIFNEYFEKIYKFVNKKKIFAIIPVTTYIILFYISKKISIPSLVISCVGIIMSLNLLLIIPEKIYKENKIYNIIKKNSMGIFLFHPIVIYVMFYLLKNVITNPYILSVIIFIISIIVSDILTILFRKLRIQFIMGEKNLEK